MPLAIMLSRREMSTHYRLAIEVTFFPSADLSFALSLNPNPFPPGPERASNQEN